MGERWRESGRTSGGNAVDHRVVSDAIEREWLTGLFTSVGQDRADAYALLRRLQDRRTMGRPVAWRDGARSEPGPGLRRSVSDGNSRKQPL